MTVIYPGRTGAPLGDAGKGYGRDSGGGRAASTSQSPMVAVLRKSNMIPIWMAGWLLMVVHVEKYTVTPHFSMLFSPHPPFSSPYICVAVRPAAGW